MHRFGRLILILSVGTALGLGAWSVTGTGAIAMRVYSDPLEPVIGAPLSPWATAIDRRVQEGDAAGAIAMIRGAALRLESDRNRNGALDAAFAAHTLWALGQPDEAAGLFRRISERASDVALQIDALRMLATCTHSGVLAVNDGLEAWRLLQNHRATLEPNWWNAQVSHVLQITALSASASGDSDTAIRLRSALLNSGAASPLPARGRGALYLLNARDAARLGNLSLAQVWYDALLQDEPDYFGDDGERLLVLLERARAICGANTLAPGAGGPVLVQELFSLWIEPEFKLVPARALLTSHLAWQLRGMGNWQLAGAIDLDGVDTLDTLVPDMRTGGWIGTAIRMAYEGSMLQAAEWHLRRGETSAGEQKLLWLAANATEGEHARIARRRLDQVSAGR